MGNARRILAYSFLVTVLAASSVQSIDICQECVCRDTKPFLIDCSALHLQEHFTDEDWDETLQAMSKITNETTLELRFDYNKIQRIYKFPKLNVLSLSFANNPVSQIDDSAFANLQNLTTLDLNHNNLTAASLPERSLFGVFNGSDNYFPLPMKYLSLAHNNIHSIDQRTFDHLPYLKTLDLSNNPLKILTGSTGLAIAQLRSLEVLDLAKTGIKKLPEGLLHDLIKLESLNLANNEFTQVPTELASSHELITLVLSGNKIEEMTEDTFADLNKLEDLEISNMPTLREIDHGTFGPLKKLRRFTCTHNRNLDHIHPDAFYGMVDNSTDWPVREMYLNDNGLTKLEKGLANWEYVDIINIQNNPFTCDCNIQWVAEILVPHIEQAKNPLDQNLLCAEPESLRGQSIVSFSYEQEDFIKCREGKGELSESLAKVSYEFQSISVAILCLGIILIIIGLSILSVIIVKRRAIARSLERYQPIRYEVDADYRDVTNHSDSLKI